MRVLGSDFTSTFRILSELTKSEEITEKDNQVIEKLVSYSAPKNALRKKTKSKYDENMIQKLKIILERDP